MTRRVVEYRARRFLVSPFDEQRRPEGARLRAVVTARLIDEITGEPPVGRVVVETDREGLLGRAAEGGRVGLVGVPSRVFPRLKDNSYQFEVSIRATGFVPIRRSVELTSDPQFPATFSPADLGPLRLHRQVTRIRGRVVRRSNGSPVPVDTATVRISEIWPQLPEAVAPGAGDPPNLIAVQPPLHTDLVNGVAIMRRVSMTPGAEVYRLLAATGPGDVRFRLTSRAGLTVGSILSLDYERDPELQEYAEIAGIDGSSDDTLPATMTLRRPVRFPHRVGAVVRRETVASWGPDNLVGRKAYATETCVFLDGMNGLDAAEVVAVREGASAADYYRIKRYSVTTDTDGYYLLPPLSRLGQVKLQATKGADTTERDVNPDYRIEENDFGLVLSS